MTSLIPHHYYYLFFHNIIHNDTIPNLAMATTPTHAASVVTVTVPAATSTADGTSNGALVSSTMSLIYIYSAATTEAQPTSTSSSSSSHRLASGAIVGIVVGCVALLVLLALGLFCYSRKIAHKRRNERAASTIHLSPSPSRHTLPSRVQTRSIAAVNSPAMQQVGAHGERERDRGGVGNSRSGHRSKKQHSRSSAPGTSRSNRYHPKTPPQELPTHYELEGSRGPQWPQKAQEVYGSCTHPVELHAGSTTNLVATAEVAQIRKAMAKEKIVTTSISTRGRGDSDSSSIGYLSPTWPMPPSSRGGGTVSETDVATDRSTMTTNGTRSVQSIQVYFSPELGSGGSTPAVDSYSAAAALSRRQSQIQIALAMSQAASMSKSPSKTSRSTVRSSGTSTITTSTSTATTHTKR